nr:leucine-rich repeat domain-containing protein [Sedimentibacter sp.]
MLKNIKNKKISNMILILIFLLVTVGCSLNDKNESTLENKIISFEDIKLKEAILNNGVDTNNDNQISIYEAESYSELLDLSNSKIKNIDGIQYFTDVKILNLSNNSITDINLISDLKGLTSLDLSYNEIEDISTLYNCTNLIMIDLSSNKIYDIDVISKLINLQFLGLSNNNISNVDKIGNLNDLKYLLIDNNNISDIYSLKNLPMIEELWINDTSVSSIPDELLIKLRKVNISNTKVDESDIKDITEIIK